jgi:1-aminocyclopropane-1-carboxylate deaminase/D-cysteine desulfhydrase-like pyridoxal-dependent ACC family enzyme
MHKLAIPIVIENQMTFMGQLQGNQVNLTAAVAGGTGFTLVALLDGLYARGVQ